MFYEFMLEGETVEGDLIVESFTTEASSQFDAYDQSRARAIEILDELDGGHIDIFDEDGVFINDVEV